MTLVPRQDTGTGDSKLVQIQRKIATIFTNVDLRHLESVSEFLSAREEDTGRQGCEKRDQETSGAGNGEHPSDTKAGRETTLP